MMYMQPTLEWFRKKKVYMCKDIAVSIKSKREKENDKAHVANVKNTGESG